jgi:hypothetical protein
VCCHLYFALPCSSVCVIADSVQNEMQVSLFEVFHIYSYSCMIYFKDPTFNAFGVKIFYDLQVCRRVWMEIQLLC